MKPDATRKMIDRIRDSWRLFTTLPEDDKRIEMEQQLNNIMRLAVQEGDFSAATVCMKRKMELNGLQRMKFHFGESTPIPNNTRGPIHQRHTPTCTLMMLRWVFPLFSSGKVGLTWIGERWNP